MNENIYHYECTSCDYEAESINDNIFVNCKPNNHEIIELLGPTTHQRREQQEIAEMPVDQFQKKCKQEFEHAREVIDKNFVNKGFVWEICTSVHAQLKIEGLSQVFPLILIAHPSTHKTTILKIIQSLPNTYRSDKFTPKSFVSHSANSKKEDLKKIDLLPRIRHKTLITPELAPLFSGNQDNLLENFGLLTSVLDGTGLTIDSGVHGQRGYEGDYSFMWLGAIVEISTKVWRLLGNMGFKIFFLRLPPEKKSHGKKHAEIKHSLKNETYLKQLEECKDVTKRFWDLIENRYQNKIEWDKQKDDDEALDIIIDIAMVLSSLRATVPTWHTNDTNSSGSNYNFETPIKEDPKRASDCLYNLARGHAVLFGRNYITKDDLKVVIPVGFSSAPKERVELLSLLINNNGKLTTDEFTKEAKVSRPTALKEMSRLVLLDLVDQFEEEGTTKPTKVISLKSQYNWLLIDEFKSFLSHTPKNCELSLKENSQKNTLCTGQEAPVPKTDSLDTYSEVQ